MANRQTKVTATLVASDYIRGVRQMGDETRKAAGEAEKLAAQREAFTELGQAALALGTIAAAGFGLAVKKFADFDEAMSNVSAATHESEENMGALREAALEAGARTVFSATESANAIEELGKAGLSTADILAGGLDGALDLAAAGGLGVADAAGIAATALQQFKLEGSDAEHVADLLAAGAGKAMGDVSDLSQALNQAGLVAEQTGLSIEETTAGLSAFAAAGLLGSDAGTSFKSMLQRLTPQSSEAKAKMDDLGISAYDAQGEFIGLSDFAGNLQGALGDLTTEQRNSALATIFGSDAVRAASVLYSEGAEGVEEWEKKVNDAGYASETAAKRLDNLKGDVEQLGGAIDTALIQTGATGNDVLRGMVQAASGLVDLYNSAPEPIKATTLAISGITAATALAGGAFFLAVPKVAAFNTALDTMGPRAKKAGRAVKGVGKFLGGPWGIALAAASVGLIALNTEIQKGVPTVEELDNALRHSATSADLLRSASERGGVETFLWGDYKDSLEDLPALMDHAIEAADNWGVAMSTSVNQLGAYDSLKKLGDALAQMASSDLPAAQKEFENLAITQGLSKEQTMQMLNEMPGFKDALTATATELGLAADDSTLLALAMGDIEGPTERNADLLGELAGKSDGASEAIEGLEDKIRNFGSAQLDVREANRAVEQSIDDLTESIEDNGTTLDINSQAGRDNEAAIDAAAKAALEAAAANYEQTGSVESASKVLATQRSKLFDVMRQFFDTDAATNDYLDSLGLIPANIKTTVSASVSDAQKVIDGFIYYNNGRTVKIHVDTEGNQSWNAGGKWIDSGASNLNGGMYSYANGGFGEGIYTDTSRPLYKFAEPELPWEAFISGRQGQEQRNIGIAYDALARLGALPQPQVIMQAPGGSGGREAPLIEGGLHISAPPEKVVTVFDEVKFKVRDLEGGGR